MAVLGPQALLTLPSAIILRNLRGPSAVLGHHPGRLFDLPDGQAMCPLILPHSVHLLPHPTHTPKWKRKACASPRLSLRSPEPGPQCS